MRRILLLAMRPFIDWLRLVRAQLRYPEARVESPDIARSASLGAYVTIYPGVEIGPRTEIGEHSYVNRYTSIGFARIGKFCSLGYHCSIGMHDHPVDMLSTSPRLYNNGDVFRTSSGWCELHTPTIIGHDVWIASHVVVLQGVTIGHGAVIAAGSVVTKDVPAYSIVAGVPAKPIRQRFDRDTVRALLDWQWWDLPLPELRKQVSLFHSRRLREVINGSLEQGKTELRTSAG
jgi:acetyltransferase-like isoleucine patch superfamily enzyme